MKEGYTTLVSVLVVGAVCAVIATSLLLFGVSSAKTVVALERSHRAKAFVNTCMEEALQQISDSTSFTGTATLSWPEGVCMYTVTSQGGQNRTVIASSTVGAVIRRSRAFVSGINPTIQITSWQEVGNL